MASYTLTHPRGNVIRRAPNDPVAIPPPPEPVDQPTTREAPQDPRAPDYAGDPGIVPPNFPTVTPPAAAPPGYDAAKWGDPQHQSAKYVAGRTVAGGGDLNAVIQALLGAGHQARPVQGSHDQLYYFDPDVGRDIIVDVMGDNQMAYWYPTFGGQYGYTPDPNDVAPAPRAAQGAPTGGSGSPALNPYGLTGQVFTDPATAQWEQLVRRITEMLTTANPLGYTDSQQELINTQFLDPLERQRQAELEQARQRLASRGISPTSGIFEEGLQGVNRQYSDLRSEGQRNIALRQVDLEDQRRRENEQRSLQGLQTFSAIPALRDSRLAQAQGSLMNVDPYQLLSIQNLIQQQGYQNQQQQSYQDQQFYQYLTQLLGSLFGL